MASFVCFDEINAYCWQQINITWKTKVIRTHVCVFVKNCACHRQRISNLQKLRNRRHHLDRRQWRRQRLFSIVRRSPTLPTQRRSSSVAQHRQAWNVKSNVSRCYNVIVSPSAAEAAELYCPTLYLNAVLLPIPPNAATNADEVRRLTTRRRPRSARASAPCLRHTTAARHQTGRVVGRARCESARFRRRRWKKCGDVSPRNEATCLTDEKLGIIRWTMRILVAPIGDVECQQSALRSTAFYPLSIVRYADAESRVFATPARHRRCRALRRHGGRTDDCDRKCVRSIYRPVRCRKKPPHQCGGNHRRPARSNQREAPLRNWHR